MHQWKQALRYRIISVIHSHQVLTLITMLHIISLRCPWQSFKTASIWTNQRPQCLSLLGGEVVKFHCGFYFNFLGVSWNKVVTKLSNCWLRHAVIWIILAVGWLSRWLIAKQNRQSMQSHMRCFLWTITEKQKLTQLFPYVVTCKAWKILYKPNLIIRS